MKMEGTSAAMDGRSQAYMDVLVAVPGIFMPKPDYTALSATNPSDPEYYSKDNATPQTTSPPNTAHSD